MVNLDESKIENPFWVLGIAMGADEELVRERYLELVRMHPPERDPEGFLRIRRAYDLIKDPLATAEWILGRHDQEIAPWSEVLERQKRKPPRLSPEFLLSLGNRAPDQGPPGQFQS